ncbi:MalM family protein [Vibrio sp. FNV 38]|nr:MalM family protein [Vibrio sp. FNV 38]
MQIKTILLSGMLGLAVVGCESTTLVEQVAQSSIATKSYSELSSTKVKLRSSVSLEINDQSQFLQTSQVDSYVAVFDVPADRGEVEFTLTSFITDTVFVPSVLIVDQNNTIIDRVESSEFRYEKPKLLLGNRLVSDFSVFPPRDAEVLRVVVFTQKDDLKGQTEVIHPARLDAEGRGNFIGGIDNPLVPHSTSGLLSLEVNGTGYYAAVPEETKTTDYVPVDVKEETEGYYVRSITEAVESENIPKALALLEEAKALNIEGAQEAFVKAINSK